MPRRQIPRPNASEAELDVAATVTSRDAREAVERYWRRGVPGDGRSLLDARVTDAPE